MKVNHFFITSISLILVSAITFTSCKTNKIEDLQTKAKDLEILDSLCAQKEFRIEIEIAYPFSSTSTNQVINTLYVNTGNNANRIDVRGDGNFIEITNDSIKGYLPFIGERRLNAGTYGGSDSAIQFDEPLKEFTKEINSNKGKLELKFKAHQKGSDNDSYNIRMNIYPSQKVILNITPVFRTFIRYDGQLESLVEDE